MFDGSTLEHVHIYLSNVSTYYILSIIISLLSVFVTIYYKSRTLVPTEERSTPITTDSSKQENPDEDSMLSNMSPVLIKQFLKAQVPQKLLTEDQLSEEKRVEKKQMEAIFKLMQEQQSKFQINSMDDLQEQMQLYGV
nr:PREDICTED: uncharacterized protein LOC109031783 [Bemisia tabaci]